MITALLSIDGLFYVMRGLHFFFGVIRIGLLYYFNFVQGGFFAETDAATKSNAIQKLVPRALWWFRWGAMFTLITGLVMLGLMDHQSAHTVWFTSRGVSILIGASFAFLMWANVWFVIWPNQKIVIQSATQAASGGKALPEAATAAARGLVASRTNTLFSIPMLFFMGAGTHLPFGVSDQSNLGLLALLMALLLGALEFNALKGKTGPMTTVKGVIHSGFGLAVVVWGLLAVTL